MSKDILAAIRKAKELNRHERFVTLVKQWLKANRKGNKALIKNQQEEFCRVLSYLHKREQEQSEYVPLP